jgi:RHS repeat-associated protein
MPWGDTLEIYGTGSFSYGYLGGLLDAATGLLYVGNGQYYDPSTGRFLTRDVYPNSPNPYVPWNPIGAILGPLALVSLIYTRKKKGSKTGTFLVLLLLVGSAGMILAACGPVMTPTAPAPTPVSTSTPDDSAPAVTPSASPPWGPATVIATLLIATTSPVATPTPPCTPTPTLTSTPVSYNGEVIPGWGCPANDDICRADRVKKVLGWIRNSNTWWGDHKDPDPKDLATWLLEHEGGSLRNPQTKQYEPNGDKWLRGIHVMVGLFSHLFGDGSITPEELSTFTAFFNPNRKDTFDSDDWHQLTTRPASYWRDDVERYWAGGLVYHSNGRAIDRWWDTKADVASGYCSTGCVNVFSVYIPIEDKTVHFGYRE